MAETECCPICGCELGLGAHEAGGVIYCCPACAEGQTCRCGCTPDGEPEREAQST